MYLFSAYLSRNVPSNAHTSRRRASLCFQQIQRGMTMLYATAFRCFAVSSLLAVRETSFLIHMKPFRPIPWRTTHECIRNVRPPRLEWWSKSFLSRVITSPWAQSLISYEAGPRSCSVGGGRAFVLYGQNDGLFQLIWILKPGWNQKNLEFSAALTP